VRRFARRVRFGLLGTLLAFGAGAGLTWWFRVTIFGWLTAPADGMLSPHQGLPIYTSPTEILSTTIKLSLTGGVVFAIPVLVGTIFYLVRPLLKRNERRLVALFLPAILLCYLAGVSFAYFLMLPVGIAFLLHFGEGIAVPTIRISEYLSLVITLIFWLGIIFELPLLIFLLAKLRLVSYQRFKRVRKFVPPAALIISAILTPTMDIVNQLLLAGPIIVLYEVGLALAWLAQPGKGRLVIRKLKEFLVGILRRVAVVLILAPSLLIGLLYVAALSFVFVWDGHLSTGTPSRAADKVEGVYMKLLAVIARMARVSQERTE
jgi:sec-independent protein translocase protein TatC